MKLRLTTEKTHCILDILYWQFSFLNLAGAGTNFLPPEKADRLRF